MKNILIISYKFPPMSGIGTRRWAKFAKYFSRSGYKVHILTINYNKVDNINWFHDVKDDDNIIIHRVKSGYPIWLMKLSSNKYISFIQKVLGFGLKKSIFYIDIAQYWAKYMIPKAKEIINQYNIKNVIVTSPPHSISYYATYLKVDLPNINLIQDFRDNWNDDTPYIYPNTLKFFWQKEKSVYMEWFVVNHSDYIVNVTNDITTRAINKFKQYENKFLTIHNGFDKDDRKNLINKDITSEKIKIIYAGGLGLGRIKAIEFIMDILLTFENNILNKIQLNIYTSFDKSKLDKKYTELFDFGVVNFYELVSPQRIFSIINEHQYCLSINSPSYPYAFGTKIFDYMMLNKSIIHISGDGELSKLLIKYKQLVSDYNKDEIEELLKFIVDDKTNKKIEYNDFDIETLIEQFKRLFK